MAKQSKNNKKLKKIAIIILSIILICTVVSIIVIKYTEHVHNKIQMEVSKVLETIEIPQEEITPQKTERMLQIAELQKENSEIVGWLEIEGTNINYPVLQGINNDYYLTHNYKHEKVSGGSLFLDKAYDFSIPSSNLLIYGHRNKKGLLFEDLIKYKDEEFYKEHTTIKFTTAEEEAVYEIISAFNSRVYYQNEKNVFRYYFFVNAENREEYEEFVNNSKKASLYETGVTAEYGEQLLTLSTCDYSQKNGRFAVVAKKQVSEQTENQEVEQ